MKKRLPALPGSDDSTLKRNRFDTFYRKRPGDIWQGHVEHFEYKEPDKCPHYFVNTKQGVECRTCRFGLTGEGLMAKKGKVYFQGKLILGKG